MEVVSIVEVTIVIHTHVDEVILSIIEVTSSMNVRKLLEMALKIVVLYNAATVNKSKCPDAVKKRWNSYSHVLL